MKDRNVENIQIVRIKSGYKLLSTILVQRQAGALRQRRCKDGEENEDLTAEGKR